MVSFRHFVESMITELPEGVVIIRKIFAGGSGVIFFFADSETHQEIEDNYRPSGMIDMQKDPHELFRVGNVVATRGYGPLLHDLAMEFATRHGIGLGPDSRENSPDSIAVWNFYLNSRPDVKKTKLPEISLNNQLRSHPSLGYVYSKADTMTSRLKAWEQLIEL